MVKKWKYLYINKKIILNMVKNDLLFIKSEKANMKIKDIAAILQKSSQRLKYSLSVMERESILHDPYCIFDYSYFGLILFRVYFKGAYIGEADKARIIKQLVDNEYVTAIYETSGEFELVVEIEAQNPSRFNKVLRRITNEIPTLRHYKVLLNIVTHLYPRYYLTENNAISSLAQQQIIIGGDREVETFDEDEKVIMRNLLEDPTLRKTALAKKSGMNIKTMKSALKSLEKRNIMKGLKYQIGTEKLEIDNFRLYLNLHNLNAEREGELLKYLRETKEIIQANKTVGDWDLEIDIESNKTRIRKLIMEFREMFKDIIENFNIMEFYECYKKTYLPKYYFENLTNEKNRHQEKQV